jgi:hypothetical protein
MDPVEIGALTTYEIANDGVGARLNFVDANGRVQSVYAPIENLKLLTLSMPKIMLEALRAQFHDSALRLVHTVENWRVERASDGKTIILTFTTPDHFAISFGVNDQDLNQLSEVIGDYELEAFSLGLHFH